MDALRPELRNILKGLGFERQALHAASLGFENPISGDWLEFGSETAGGYAGTNRPNHALKSMKYTANLGKRVYM